MFRLASRNLFTKPVGRPTAWVRRPYSSQKEPLNQTTMGQPGPKNGGNKKGLFFGFHPMAVLASLTLLGSGYLMIVKPYLDWNQGNQELKAKNKQQQQQQQQQPKGSPFDEKTVVFVLGGPGSGKGTNSAKLVEEFGFVHLSAGDLLRAEQKKEGSEYGQLIADYIREGLIVPHEITIGLLRKAMMERAGKDRFLIDGFPRNLVQARAFEDEVCAARKVLYFACPEEELLKRLLERGKTSGRTDDNRESIAKRFRTHVNDGEPVIEDYRKKGKVIEVSCLGTPAEVYRETAEQIKAIF